MHKFAIILTIFYAGVTFSQENISTPKPINTTETAAADINSPDAAALNIMTNALLALKKLKKQNNSSVENIKTIIEVKMLPNIAIEVSTKLALKKHWNKLNPQQKLIFQQYISQSLVKDYGAILGSYDALENINITVHADVKHYDNKAIVKLIISFNEDDEPIIISLKMVQTTRWQIYDLVFSGVSIIKNYQAQFNSHIKRKGINSLIAKIIKKLG